MTLAPVFRSPEAVKALQERGYWDRLEGSLKAHRKAAADLRSLLAETIHSRYLGPPAREEDLLFLQENFFLILFHSLFKALDCGPERLDLYTLLNLCIRGTVLAGDNLFDEEEKLVLPLVLGSGPRFRSIVQLLCFQDLVRRVLDRHGAWVEPELKDRFHREFLTTLVEIGSLEGSEEAGVEEVPRPEEMIRSVHRVRGGSLFALAFIAPRILEQGRNGTAWKTAEEGIRLLGAAFQIVDDLTDFEFDLKRKSHNLVVAQATHEGTPEERERIKLFWGASTIEQRADSLESGFRRSASQVFERARQEAETGFIKLKEIGFWFDPADASIFVRAIAGDSGFRRVQNLS